MIIGRLGRDPDMRYTSNGTPVTTLNVATDESYIDRDGNRQDRTEWHRVAVFQKQAELCSNYLTKGSLVFVEGSLQTRKWQDQQGQTRYTTEIKAQHVQFLDRRGGGQNQEEGGEARGSWNQSGAQAGGQWNQNQQQSGGWNRQSGQRSGWAQGQGGARPAGRNFQPGQQDDDYGAYPQEAARTGQQAPRQGAQGDDYAPEDAPRPAQPAEAQSADDYGPAFPSEAAMDKVPF